MCPNSFVFPDMAKITFFDLAAATLGLMPVDGAFNPVVKPIFTADLGPLVLNDPLKSL